jgi:23S rRNA U2552 (ribose-2'-O)-methylase RlmE/FtsJ
MAELKPWFRDMKRIRPESVRQESREFFIACLGFKRPVDPARVEIDAPPAVS